MPASEVPAAERVRRLELIVNQDGAVVSRILLKRATGTLTLFERIAQSIVTLRLWNVEDAVLRRSLAGEEAAFMRLFEHPDFEQAIIQAVEHFRAQGLRPAVIEKDYYVTEALRISAATSMRLYADTLFLGRPPFAPLRRAAASLALVRLVPPRRPAAAANNLFPKASSTRPGT